MYKKTDPRFHVNVHERRQGRVLRDSKNRGAMHGSCALPSTQTWDQHNTMPASPKPGRDGPEGYRVVMYHNAAETPRTTGILPSPPLRILLAVKTSYMQSIVAVLCYHQDLHSVFKNWFFRTVTLPTFTTSAHSLLIIPVCASKTSATADNHHCHWESLKQTASRNSEMFYK